AYRGRDRLLCRTVNPSARLSNMIRFTTNPDAAKGGGSRRQRGGCACAGRLVSMSRKNRASLTDRVAKGAEASLAAQNYVSLIEALVGIGWLDPGAVRRWRHGQIDCLEEALQTNPSRISEAM